MYVCNVYKHTRNTISIPQGNTPLKTNNNEKTKTKQKITNTRLALMLHIAKKNTLTILSPPVYL